MFELAERPIFDRLGMIPSLGNLYFSNYYSWIVEYFIMQLDTKTLFPFLHSGVCYDSGNAELIRLQRTCLALMDEFNATKSNELEKRAQLLKKMTWECGDNCFVEAPLYMNFGGNHLILGDNVYINFNFRAVDDTFITIGSNTLIGPNVTIATALHPEDPELRAKYAQYNKPVVIGKNVWIGASVTICPGVTIGDNVVIGAGSVVTKDIPSDMVAFGVPCRPIRPVKRNDKEMIKF